MSVARSKDIKSTRHLKIAILGFGREGQSILKFLQNRERRRKKLRRDTKDAKKNEIWVLDKNPKSVSGIGYQVSGVRTGKNYLNPPVGGLNQFDIVFRSPGVPYNLPEIQKAKKAGIEISSATKLFFEEINHSPLAARRSPLVIGVTGTKGKGTTSTLIYEILKAAHKSRNRASSLRGKNVFLAGNIGKPPLDILPKIKRNSWVVLELSSFQLIDLETSPAIAVVLMVTSEHLDWHKNQKEYVEAKAGLVRFQSKKDYAVINRDYPRSMSYARKTKARVFTFSRKIEVGKGAWVENGYFWFSNGKKEEKIGPVSELQIPGEHNWENAAAAITVAKILGVENKIIRKVLHNFKGLEHRLEFVANIKGIKYYNDSYSTIPETAEVAMAAFEVPKILILGGSSKGSDFRQLGRAISGSKTIKAIIGIGREWPLIKKHIKNPWIQIIEGCKSMKEIVRKAAAVASAGDAVILSPACASFDMFKNYTDRGQQFKKFVKALKSH